MEFKTVFLTLLVACILTFVMWYAYGKQFRRRNLVLQKNLILLLLYVMCCAWDCKNKQHPTRNMLDEIYLLFLVHLLFFWLFMFVQVSCEFIYNQFKHFRKLKFKPSTQK